MKDSLKRGASFLLILILNLFFMPKNVLAVDLTAEQIAFHNSGQSSVIISEEDFLNINSLTPEQIQGYLVHYGSFLKDYIDTSAAGRNRSAAQIIWDAAHGKYEAGGVYREITLNEQTGTVNPIVILTYLQKEQSLVQATTWDDWKMLASMGYNCYQGVSGDNNGNNCKDAYEGFTKQVENGAWQLRFNYEAATKDDNWWNTYYGTSHFQVGQAYHTSDGYDVTLTNRATASVYRYTPYVYYSAYNVWNIYYNRYKDLAPAAQTLPQTDNPPPPPPPRKSGDANSDNAVDSTDLSILADQWGKGVTANTGADYNGDSVVDSTDLSILADGWGK